MNKVSLKYGIISEIDYASGTARVFIDELDIVTDWLTLPKRINENKIFSIKQQVSILIHENGEDGMILLEEPHDGNRPPSWASDHTEGVQFKDGTTIIYDTESKKLQINAGAGEIEFVCSKLTVSGDVIAGTEQISLVNHIHTTPVGPSGKPIPL